MPYGSPGVPTPEMGLAPRFCQWLNVRYKNACIKVSVWGLFFLSLPLSLSLSLCLFLSLSMSALHHY
jgi:hypothetical protein